MTKASKTIKCYLPNDYEMNIVRQQINVLPNFSMTDYASQGKTRPYNVVNLSHCRNFQSIYTCLSRSSNAAGTLIIRGFNPAKVTNGLPGHLRQEFRELHILNVITEEIYEGRLNKSYLGTLRNPMLYKYQTDNIKKDDFNSMHHSLKSSDEEFVIKNKSENGIWNLDFYQNLIKSNQDIKKVKRKFTNLHVVEEHSTFESSKKKKKPSSSSLNLNSQSPLGLTWDENDYSCAYDSLFTVLRHIWFEGQLKQKAYFENGPKYFRILHSQFTSLFNETCTFEAVRDNLRFMLNREKPSQYLYGRNYTDIDEV